MYLRDASSTSYNWTGLVPHTNYQFAVLPFTNKSAYIRYNQAQQATAGAEPNTAPEVQPFRGVVVVNTSKSVELSGYADDADGDSLTFEINDTTVNGSLKLLDNQTGLINYIPDADFEGSDNFSYRVSDN